LFLYAQVEKRPCHFSPTSDNHYVGGRVRMVNARLDWRDQQRKKRLPPCRVQGGEGEPSRFNFMNNADEDKEESFLERLARAWAILFPMKANQSESNASIAKQRLKMILISDRCSVNDDAKRRIVTNIVGALSDFVEIESEDKVQLNVSSDPDLGTVYSVTVPVRRVRPQYQEFSHELVNAELRSFDYEEEEGNFRMVDIRFEHPDNVHQDVVPDVFQDDQDDSQAGSTSDFSDS
jgi:septum formation topological specificity factor MinE